MYSLPFHVPVSGITGKIATLLIDLEMSPIPNSQGTHLDDRDLFVAKRMNLSQAPIARFMMVAVAGPVIGGISGSFQSTYMSAPSAASRLLTLSVKARSSWLCDKKTVHLSCDCAEDPLASKMPFFTKRRGS